MEQTLNKLNAIVPDGQAIFLTKNLRLFDFNTKHRKSDKPELLYDLSLINTKTDKVRLLHAEKPSDFIEMVRNIFG